MIKLILLFNYLISLGVTRPEAEQLTCLAFEESSFNEKAIHINNNKTKDFGLFQINSIWKKTCNTDLLTIEGNVKCALELYYKEGPEIWATYRRCK